MAVTASAKRYAQAVAQLAQDDNGWDSWLDGLRQLAALAADPSFSKFMESPRVPLDAKRDLMSRNLDVAPLVLNLAQLLVSRRRVDVIPGLYEEFQRLLDERRGIAHATVITAVPLGAAEEEALKQQLAQFTGKQVMLTAQQDPSIIGGLVVRIGDKLLDGSIRGQLESLRRQLAQAT